MTSQARNLKIQTCYFHFCQTNCRVVIHHNFNVEILGQGVEIVRPPGINRNKTDSPDHEVDELLDVHGH